MRLRTSRLVQLTPLALASLAACATDSLTAPAVPTGTPNAAKQVARTPAAPPAITAVAGNAQATVSWQASTNATAVGITGYRVIVYPGGRQITYASTSTSQVVTKLTNGTSYTFYVRAYNAAGYGPWSVRSAPVVPSASTTPTPAPTPTPSAGSRWVMGYYVGYQRSLYPETSVDFTYLTHVTLGAVRPTTTGGVTTDFYVDNTNGPIMARNLSSRAHAAGRKAILMIGGAGYRDGLVSATSNTYRATFVANVLKTMDNLGYDGVDLDWEPVSDADKPQIIQFLKDLRAARPSILVSFPVFWTNANFGADSWYGQLAPLVDRLNVMSYEMAGNWGGWKSWHSAALYGEGADHPSSVSSTVNAYRAAGVPAAKIGVGIGTYGSCWRGTTAPLQTLASSAGVVASDNAMSYANIVAQYYTASAYQWDATARMGYLSFPTPRGPQQCNLVSYEDPQSVAEKGAYVKSQGLGGAIVWTLGEGHLSTAAAGQQDPLVRAAYTAIAP